MSLLDWYGMLCGGFGVMHGRGDDTPKKYGMLPCLSMVVSMLARQHAY